MANWSESKEAQNFLAIAGRAEVKHRHDVKLTDEEQKVLDLLKQHRDGVDEQTRETQRDAVLRVLQDYLPAEKVARIEWEYDKPTKVHFFRYPEVAELRTPWYFLQDVQSSQLRDHIREIVGYIEEYSA